MEEKLTELHRQNLEDALQNILYKPMTIVVAPSGYGKTTVVRKFFKKHPETEAIWFSLGEGERDDNWLWQRICFQFIGLSKDVFNQLIELGLPKTGQEMECLFQIIIDNLNRSICLVIDDYQECKSCEINYILYRLGQADIPNLHLVVISRTHPDFPYEEMMLRGCCSILDQRALTLSVEETVEIYKLNGVTLSEKEIENLVEYTDGWIAAVYLTLLDYKRIGHLRLSMDMIHLLRTAIFDKFPKEVQQVLAQMSVFDKYTLEEARYVTEIDLQEISLQSMMETYGFGHYDIKDGKYMVHSLLRTVAREELDKSGADKNRLYYRDGVWQEKNDSIIRAIINYRKCNQRDEIYRLLSGKDNIKLYDKAPLMFKEFFLEEPLNIRLQHPAAYLSYIYFLSIQYNGVEGQRMLEEALQGYEICNEQDLPWDYDRIKGELSIIESLFAFNNLDYMTGYMQKADELLQGNASSIFESNLLTYGTPYTLHLYHREIGDLKRVVEREKEYTRYFMKLIQHVEGGWDELHDAEYELTIGNMEKALELAKVVSAKAKFRKQTCVIISGYYTRLWVLIYLGKVEEFEQAIEELHAEMKNVTSSVLVIDYELTYGSAYAKINRLDKIPEWIYNFDLDECSQIVKSVRSGCMTYGIILQQLKQWVHLDALAEQMMMPYKKLTHLYVLIAAYLYKAIAATHLENETTGMEWLKKALHIAEADDIKAPFIENAKELLPLLSKLSDTNSFSKKLLPYCETYAVNVKKFDRKKEKVQLTPREKEIMQLVKEGLHNNEIGERLHIAPVTVEKTLTNIYRKLGVSNRAAAVSKCGGGERALKKGNMVFHSIRFPNE